MNANEYRKWIEAGLKDYGDDPWFFIRELAQNSRDAGAGTIRVKADHNPDKNETLVFEDDGRGMTYRHAVQYLFRLYASSKSKEKYSAGRFGIGFWTVLKFNPTKIIIESCYKKETWAVEIDANLNAARIAPDLNGRGVRITLVRPAIEKSRAAFLYRVEESLNRYCSYLRRNTRRAGLLPVLFEGKSISGPMKLPGPVTLGFKTRRAEGVVGLGPRPQVNLYARGLPVWQGATLEELSHTPPSQTPRGRRRETTQASQMAVGLAPVYLVNGSSLEVNISRRKIIDNRALQKVRETAENALSQLVEIASDRISPRNFLQRSRRRFKKNASAILHSPWKISLLLLIILLPLEYVLLKTLLKNNPARVPPPGISLQAESNRYTGGTVKLTNPRLKVELTYQPPTATWFKLYHVETYRRASGFTQELQPTHTADPSTLPPVDCGRKTIIVSFQTLEKGDLLLPRPLFYYIDPYSITINGILLSSVRYDPHAAGGILVTVPYSGILRYRCCPPVEQTDIAGISPETLQRATQLPENLFMPETLQKELQDSLNSSTAQKLHTAVELTVKFLKYNDSEETAKKYADASSFSQFNDWFQKVIRIGAGDCDVLNGAAIVFLRRMGVPARLVVGLTGENGRVLPGMHAWVEYFDSGWQSFDVTAYASVESSTGFSAAPSTGANAPPPTPPQSSPADPKTASPPSTGTTPVIPPGIQSLFYNTAFLSILSFLFLSSLFLLLLKSKLPGITVDFREPHRVEENLAGMALHALLHPGAWADNSNIRDIAIIPTIKGVSISLRRALKLSRSGKLFYIHHDNPLVDRLKESFSSFPIPILESGHPAFDPIIRSLPEAVNLDRITGLKPVMPGKGDDSPLGRLLAAVNRLVSPPCLLAPGMARGKEDLLDVDLSHLPLPGSFFPGADIPTRFIAVNPNCAGLKELASLYKENPPLAQFRWVEMLLKESNLFPGPPGRILEKASLLLVEEIL